MSKLEVEIQTKQNEINSFRAQLQQQQKEVEILQQKSEFKVNVSESDDYKLF